MELKGGIVAISDKLGNIIGTGFMVADATICTCAHIVSYGAESIVRLPDGSRIKTIVDEKYFSEEKDIAILRFAEVPSSTLSVLPIGSSSGTIGHRFYSFGYAVSADIQGIGARGQIIDIVGSNGQELLQLSSPQISAGFSGAPVLDEDRALVVGMVSRGSMDDAGRNFQTSFAIPSETLQRFFPEINLFEVESSSRDQAEKDRSQNLVTYNSSNLDGDGSQEQNYRRAIQSKSPNVQIYQSLGSLLEKEGRTDEAASIYREAIERLPVSSVAQIYQSLGSLLEKEGRTDEAASIYREAIERLPTDTGFEQSLEELLKDQQFCKYPVTIRILNLTTQIFCNFDGLA